jgi:preprotein translocase subunit SecA
MSFSTLGVRPQLDRWWEWAAREEVPPPIPRGVDAFATSAAAALRSTRRDTTRFLARAAAIEVDAARSREERDDVLRQRLADIAATVARGAGDGATTAAAFALLAIAVERTVGFALHRVQLAAALALAEHRLVELATGEGKSVTATLPAALAAFRGRGVHVLTANDYLAVRDAAAFAPLYGWAGLRVATVLDGMEPAARRQGYVADVTYATHREVAADFVRDRLLRGGARDLATLLARRLAGTADAPRMEAAVQRGLAAAIVDEADSLLLDDATTPLLLSGGGGRDEAALVAWADAVACGLAAGTDFVRTAHDDRVALTAEGAAAIDAAGASASLAGIGPRDRRERVERALAARHAMRRDVHYVVEEDRVVIVDEATGRRMPDRAWREGLHAAVEAKEGVAVRATQDTIARTLFVRFFRRYARLAGMTGTAWEARRELRLLYGIETVRIPTHRPDRRTQSPPRVFASDADRWQAVVTEVGVARAGGRPVLVGTRSVERSLHLARLLDGAGIPHDVLNALSHAREAEIVARAGEAGRVTVATNMAGRGTDVPLAAGVAERGGLHVVATEAHASRRVDRQLAGRAGRQGDPGSAVLLASLEDELLRRHAPVFTALAARAPRDAAGALPAPLAAALLDAAQRASERHARRARQHGLAAEDDQERRLGFAKPE